MWALTTTGRSDHLELCEIPEPTPGPDEILVEVTAVSLNRGNLRGIDEAEPGQVLGWDLAGVDEDGRRAVGLVGSGAFASRVAVPRAWLAPIPEGVSDATAAALPVAFVTAVQTLRDLAGVRAGERVAITGAAGGVGVAAVQLAVGGR